MKITINDLFSGIGAQFSALKKLGITCEVIHTSDIDQNAVLSYAAIHCGLTTEIIIHIQNTLQEKKWLGSLQKLI